MSDAADDMMFRELGNPNDLFNKQSKPTIESIVRSFDLHPDTTRKELEEWMKTQVRDNYSATLSLLILRWIDKGFIA